MINNKCVNCPCSWWWCNNHNDCLYDFQSRRKRVVIEPDFIKPKKEKRSDRRKAAKVKKKKLLKDKLKPYFRGVNMSLNIYLCHYCQAELTYKQLTVDHVKAKCYGGKNTIDNLVPACFECNQNKGSKDYDYFVDNFSRYTK